MRQSSLLLGLALLGAGSLTAGTPYSFQPVQVYGGGYITGMVFHPTVQGLAYARTDMGGAYKWNPGTATWTPLTDFLSRDQADYMGNLALALDRNDPNRVYLLCGKYTQSWAGNGAVLRSSDQGATWTITAVPFKVGGNEEGRGAGERLAVDPNLGSILFVGSNASGLYRSTTFGAAWSAVASFPGVNPTFILFDRSSATLGNATQTIYVGVAATTNNLYRSTDGGTSWALVPGQPTGNIPLRAAFGDGGRLYMTYGNVLPNNATAGAMWRLDTGAGTWTNLNPPTGQGGWCGVSVLPGANDQVTIATLDRWWPADEVYTSVNNGAAWTAKLTTGTRDDSQAPWASESNPHWITDIQVDPFDANHAFFVTGYGFYRTQNLMAASPTWAFSNAGIEQTVPLQLASPPSGAPLLTAMGDVDGFRHDNLDAPTAQRLQPIRGTTMAIAFAEALPSKLVKAYNAGAHNYGAYSLNGGTSWTNFGSYPAGTTGGGTRTIAISADGNSIVWCPPGGACSRSTNNGGSWTAVTGGVPGNREPVADRVNANKFYIFDWATGQLWVSTNGGASFAVGATGLGILADWQAGDASLKANLGREGHLWLTTGTALRRSTDSGASFSLVPNVTAAWEIATGLGPTLGAYPSLFLFGTVGGVRGFYRSDDTAASWVRINDDQHQYGWIHDFSGDPRIHGRLYFAAEGRGAHYGDLPAGGTPTSTATRTSTRTATGTPTPSATPSTTPSRTATPSASPTGSPTRTPSGTPSRTLTSTATPSATPLAPTATATPSRTASPSPSSSATPTSSPSASPSFTASPSASHTPSVTVTATEVPAGSSPTVSPTLSPSPSPSPTASPTPTATLSATVSVSETPTFTGTLTASRTFTATSTPTATPTATDSTSSTSTLTGTLTAGSTLTATPTMTTFAASATATPTMTTFAASATATPTMTTFAASATATPTMTTFAASPTPTPTLTAFASPTATPAVSGSLKILAAIPFPHPNAVEIRVHLDGPADTLRLDRYSSALVLMSRHETGPLTAGWNRVPLPKDWAPVAGLSFVRVSAQRAQLQSLPVAPLRLFWMP